MTSSLIVIDDLIINANSIKHITPTHIYYEGFNEMDISDTTTNSAKSVHYHKKTRIQEYDSADNIKSGTTNNNNTKHKWSWIKYEITPSQFRQIKDCIKNGGGEGGGWLH